MSAKILFRTLALVSVLCASAGSAAAQGQGYGVGQWTLATYGGRSVCFVTLSERFVPHQQSYRAFVRGGPRCNDPRVHAIALWTVRGNSLKLVDGVGREIAALDEQNPNLYAAGDWQLARAGYGPDPGYQPPVDRPGQGYGVGEWNLINQGSGSVCRVVLSNRLVPDQNAYRAYPLGGRRCDDWIGQSVGLWVVRGNTLHLSSSDGSELGKLEQQGPNVYAGSGLVLQRRR